MKRLVFVLFLWIPQLLASQTRIIYVMDEGGKVIQFANISLYNIKDSTKLCSTVSDSLGSFQFKEKKGVYRLSVKCLGYEDYERITLMDTLKVITLHESSFQLREVVVNRSSLNRGNSLLINIENTNLSKLHNLSDILPYMPFVTSANNEIEVIGHGTPIFYLNGHKARDVSKLLKTRADEIKNIEVVTSPGSEYDASAQSIIKITTKRQEEGLGGNTEVSLFYLGNYVSETMRNLFNYRNGSYDVFANINMRNTRTFTTEDQTSILQLQSNKERKQHSDLLNKWLGFDGGLGFDYITNKLSYGGKYTYTWTPRYVDNYDVRGLYKLVSNVISNINSSNSINRRTGIHSIESFLSYKFTQFIKIKADNYFASSKDKTEQNIKEESKGGNSNIGISNGCYDYIILCQKILSELEIGTSNLKFGLEGTITNYSTDFRSSISNDITLSHSKSTRKERTISAFWEFKKNTSIVDFTFGLRYEHSLMRYENNLNDQKVVKWYDNNIFPSLSLKKIFGDLVTGLSYTVKIHRPNYQELRSNVEYYSPLEFSSGNTSLKSSMIHNVSLLSTYKKFNAILSYKYIKNPIVQTVGQFKNNESILYTSENLSKYQQLSFSISWSKAIGCWTSFINTSLQKPFMEYNGKKYNSAVFSLSFNNVIALNNGYTFYFDTSFFTGGHIMLYNYKPRGNVNLGLSKSFFKDKLGVDLSWTDIFKTNKDKKHLQSLNIDLIKSSYRNLNGIMLTVTYKFNSQRSRYSGSNAGISERSRL